MTGKQLKNAILQLAIQGKLVPQDATDEPASVLLAQIHKEKEQLLKAGKLKKKDLATTPITDEEKPFEIPESWEWVRLGEIFSHNNGKQLNRADTKGELHDYITTSNLYWDSFDLKEIRQMLFTDEELVRCTATKGDLLVCEGGDVGRSAIWDKDFDICIQNHIHRLRAYCQLCTRYFLYLLMFNKSTGLIGGKGIGIQGLSAKALHNILVALPPLAEQHRIVAKIEELMPLVEEYGAAQEKLNRLNEVLPEALKKSILQQAIQGKLVPQDANDEPASVLLAQIRKEKEKLVKAGKLKKKDLETTPITDEEKPFEIPESWEWVRLGDIFSHNNGKQLNRADTKGKLHDYITTSNLYWDNFDLKEVRQMLFTEDELVRCTATKGDLLVCEGGDVGRSAIWDKDYDICIQNHIHRLRAYSPLCTRYFLYLLMFNKSIGLIGGKGIGIQGLSATALHSIPVALPPLAEQRRIVAKVEELFVVVEGMEGEKETLKKN